MVGDSDTYRIKNSLHFLRIRAKSTNSLIYYSYISIYLIINTLLPPLIQAFIRLLALFTIHKCHHHPNPIDQEVRVNQPYLLELTSK